MANPDPSKTEWPTGKRISETRDKGNILQSPDITSVVILTAGTLLLFMTLPRTAEAFRDILVAFSRTDCRATWLDSQVAEGGVMGMEMLVRVLGPACLGICLAAILVMRAQVGSYFSFGPLKWDFSKLWNPKALVSEMLPSKESIRNLIITGSKVFIVGWLIYISLRNDYPEFLSLNRMPLWNGVMWVVQEVVILVFKIIALLIIIAATSYWLRRKEYYDAIMMSKQEVKDERKNQEGDPQVKAKIRGKMRELFVKALRGNLKKANLVVTNPTHVAVALKYEPGKDFAPLVVAKGLRKRAEHIKFMAKAYGIPIVEAPPLARSLYRNVKVASYIPPEFYRAVAAILAKLHKSGVGKRKNYVSHGRAA